MISLDQVDRALLAGEMGPAAARAMAIMRRYGDAAGARSFVSIASAHVDGCLYHGPSSIDFARLFVNLGGRVRVPTTLNVAAVDVTHPEWHCGPPGLIAAQTELTALHEQLGCLATLTCAPYQRINRPVAGEHVAWAESNAIVFANSVLGARTDRYGDFADLCAALTGRVPRVGYHCEEKRQARFAVSVPSVSVSPVPRELFFDAIGYVLGQRVGGEVALVRGLPENTTEDELKALGAAGASSGSLALFHAEGLTPEAAHQNACGIPQICITPEELQAAVTRLCPVQPGEKLAAICLGTPHYSLAEFRALGAAVQGRTRNPEVPLFVSTSRDVAATVAADPALQSLREFGIQIVVDTCTYVAPVVRAGTGAILTTSAKFAHYAPGNIRCRTGLATLDRCLRSASLGVVAA